MRALIVIWLVSSSFSGFAGAQTLEQQLIAEPRAELAAAAKRDGDASRGAILFFQPLLACGKCHTHNEPQKMIGPDLSRLGSEATDEHLIESILAPSKMIRKGFEPVSVVTNDGRTVTGFVAEERSDQIVLRDPLQNGKLISIKSTDIDERTSLPTSLMPSGQVNQLASRQQFLDLARYLLEIRDGGLRRALELQPDPALTAAVSLPDYEANIDHAGMIGRWNSASLKRGAAVYQRVCANCHGTLDAPGSLPISLRFAEGKLKNGSDPFAMYQTLTRGFGFMTPQAWMVPQQKYDVIHYIRETYLKPRNPSQYFAIDVAYRARLPKGNSFGPEPSTIEPWVVMDYGPSLINTYEIPGAARNLAYKGIAMRLDVGAGGVSRGRHWSIFDHDTLRMAASWSGSGFIDWHGIHFNGQHQVHPTIVGQVLVSNPVGPGWANPDTDSFDDPRLRGRDNRPYGPLPRAWAKYRGLYQLADRSVVAYSVGSTDVLESHDYVPPPTDEKRDGFFVRTLHLEKRPKPLTMLVATVPDREWRRLGNEGVVATGSLRDAWLVAGLEKGGASRLEWNASQLLLKIPAGNEPLDVGVWMTTANDEPAALAQLAAAENAIVAPDLSTAVARSRIPDAAAKPATRWLQKITTDIVGGAANGPFAVDVLTPPVNNPWLAQTRLTGFDFFADGDAAAVCSWDGDVWLVNGLLSNPPNGSKKLVWQRIAAGLFQPLGLKILDGQIFVTCRDQIVILRDFNGDRETDFYECFNNDHQVTEHFHEFAMGLQTDAAGNLYYAKSARHALPAVVPHHGTLLRVSPDGSRTDILANGFRAANGVCLNPDGSFIVTDQEGHWNPKNRINWVTPRADGRPNFHGNLFGYHDVTDPSDAAMVPPLCWITNAFDRSPAELLWVPSKNWGPLAGSLLNLSYGYGKIFVVPHEEIAGQKQGGMCELPLPPFPTGIQRGRFHPQDGQLYVCGMFAWAGSATQPGGFYRIRHTGQPMHVPSQLHAHRQGLTVTLTDPIDPASVTPENVAVKVWSLKRTANYGSDHYDERRLNVSAAKLAADGKTLHLTLPDIRPTWCMEIKLSLRSTNGAPVHRTIHNTIHRLGESGP